MNFVKGDRVQFSQVWLRDATLNRRQRFGVVKSTPRARFVPVVWDGTKTVSYYHPDFIEHIAESEKR